MAATPKTGILEFTTRSGQKFSVGIYNSDVASAFLKMNKMGSASATVGVDFITAPEDMTLTDVSVVTGIVDTANLLLFIDDGAVPGRLVNWANCVNTLTSRSFPALKISKGRKIQFQQVA